MGRKNFGKKKKSQQKKQKKGRKPSKGYPGIPQEQVTCREVAIYVPPDEESNHESDSDEDPQFYNRGRGPEEYYRFDFFDMYANSMLYRFFEAMVLSELFEERMRNRGFSRRARR